MAGRRRLVLDVHIPKLGKRARIVLALLLFMALPLALLTRASLYLRELTRDMVLSDATDLMTLCINGTVSEELASHEYDYDYFVELCYDEAGQVCAVKTHMSRVNALSSRLLSDIVDASNGGRMSLSIPIGNLLGSSLLLGRGPELPVDITMLTSSRVDLKNDFSSAGINQTKHQIKLDVVIDIDVVLPWNTVTTEVVSEILIAETVIVGQVPETYFDTFS